MLKRELQAILSTSLQPGWLQQIRDRFELSALFTLGEQLLDKSCRGQSGEEPGFELLESFLDESRSPAILCDIYADGGIDAWFELQLKIIKACNFTTGSLFRRRVAQYADRPLFKVIADKDVTDYSWQTVGDRVASIARAIMAELDTKRSAVPVAILAENSLHFVLLDLACLCYGIANVIIPANSVESHVNYILSQTKPQVLFVSTSEQLAKVPPAAKVTSLRKIVCLDKDQHGSDDRLCALEDFLTHGQSISGKKLQAAAERTRLTSLASVMYTSGTTEAPKGIMFTQLNIVSKRFARACALPDIGDKDAFLCYLPLFHTFGRWFEMMGCIFWGSTYAFMQSPRLETMIDNMRRIRPTVFISIPKKWIQLYDHIQAELDGLPAGESATRKAVKACVGGRLKWGLSAAGFLDPDVFTFFQTHGIELMSGFGMTEATGGITMTPPGQYKEYSVGLALPGVKIRLAEDGEMMIKGPYVMKGYFQDSGPTFRSGWLPTGDIFTKDADGFYAIVDRKKEIYKNSKGETIAPQKIENLFRDFEAISRVYLVGDHRSYNTVLIYPNYKYEQLNLRQVDEEKLREFFGSIVVSVNRFLAPYERIVDFAIIGRDFDAGKGEITEKGTFKRRLINKNFQSVIDEMYERPYVALKIGDLELRVPNWILRQKGLTADDLQARKSSLVLKPLAISLRVDCFAKPGKGALESALQVIVGDCAYAIAQPFVDLGELIELPSLWLGNRQLEHFIGTEIFNRQSVSKAEQPKLKRSPHDKPVKLDAEIVTTLKGIFANQQKDIRSLHVAACVLQSDKIDLAVQAVQYLQGFLHENENLIGLARLVLQRTATVKNTKLRREAFRTLILNESDSDFEITLEEFVTRDPRLLDEATIAIISQNNLTDQQLEGVYKLLGKLREELVRPPAEKLSKKAALALLRLITAYGTVHPSSYKAIRREVYKCLVYGSDRDIQAAAKRAIENLRLSLRAWLGANQKIAVDPETAQEYGWADVLTFGEAIEAKDRARLADAIETIPLIREAIFLFTGGTLIRLQDISHKGIWVAPLGSRYGKSVYRVAVQTRHTGGFDLAVNLNNSLSKEDVNEEITWLICTGEEAGRRRLAEDFGGYWPEYDLWSEEFIPGETVSNFFIRLANKPEDVGLKRMKLLWPYMAWTGLQAYVDFWCRTDRKLVISDPSPDNVIVPAHDYHIGARMVSISAREPFQTILEMIVSFHHNFVRKIELTYKSLRGQCGWDVLFSAFLEVLGEAEGLRILESTLDQIQGGNTTSRLELPGTFEKQLRSFVHSVQTKGFLPQRLHFAIKRFHRWLALNPEAIPRAQLQTLGELHSTYALNKLDGPYLGTRVQYFRNTVFAGSSRKLKRALDGIVTSHKDGSLTLDQLAEPVAELQKQIELSEAEAFFLTRMSFPHLRPSDTAELISLTQEGENKADLVVFTNDLSGNLLSIRHPATPKEIAKLHQLFVSANLPVEFQPDHKFLVVLDERGQVLGGLFYRETEPKTVHLDKIVVETGHRRQGISDSLLRQFFNRLHSEGYETVTVGFLRPEFFYRFGFAMDQRYGNMVKKLHAEEPREPVEELLAEIS